MVRDANSDRSTETDIEQTIFTVGPDSKQISSEYLSSDDVLKEAKKPQYNNRDAFIGGGTLESYEPIPEYEGRHRYDPKAQWTEDEEKKLVRKLDYRICSWVCLMFFGTAPYVSSPQVLDRTSPLTALSPPTRQRKHLASALG